MFYATFGLYDFVVYLKCNSHGCGLPARGLNKHRKGSSRNPLKAWRLLRKLRREFYKSTYYMVMERRQRND
jgi:hypothetical protein